MSSNLIQIAYVNHPPASVLRLFFVRRFDANPHLACAVFAVGSTPPLPELASLDPEEVGIAPGWDVPLGTVRMMVCPGDEELEHNLAEPELVQKMRPFESVHQSCYLETDE